MVDKKYYVYIVTNKKHGTPYIGFTNNLIRRMEEHKSGVVKGFTEKYNLHKLVYFEEFTEVEEALAREKAMKHWLRQWKINLIEEVNPDWDELIP